MPREKIESPVGPYHVKVGWASDRDVQIGVEVDGERSIFWTLFNDRDMKASLAEKIQSLPVQDVSAQDYAENVLNILDEVSLMGYQGLWSTLDRSSCNRLIRLIRRARDAAFGADA